MNKLLQEELWRQRVRQMHRKVTRETKLLNEAQANLYTTFIQPFTDIIDAAQLTGKDILNSLKLQFDLLFTLGTKGMDDALADFDKRKANIEKDWAPIMERTDRALEGDADLIALVLAPTAFITSEAAVAAYDKAESFADYMESSGWKVPLIGSLFGGAAVGGGGAGAGGSGGGSGGDEKNLLQKLGSLFYIEGSWHEGDLILEQEEEKEKEGNEEKKEKKPSLEKEMAKFLEETGIQDKFEKDAKELITMQENLIKELLATALPRLTLITALTSTADVDEFVGVIDKAEQEGLDLQSSGMDTIKSEVEESAKKIGQSEEFRAQTAEMGGVDVENLSDEDVLKAAKKVAFTNAKQSFDEQAKSGKEKIKNEALELLEEKSPDETNLNILKTSEKGAKYIQLIEDTKQKIENA
jgi:hypothetical protein